MRLDRLAAQAPLLCFGAMMLVGCAPNDPGPGGPGDDGAATPSMTSIGPFAVASGEERTVCILKRLDNAEDMVATSFVIDLAPVSHHLIVYRSNATTEQLTPFPCHPFEGLVIGVEVPLVIATKAHTEYVLPSGVGLELEKQQMVKIEAHYLNPGASAAQGSAQIAVKGTTVAPAGSYAVADIGVWGTSKINVPAQGNFETPVQFQAGIAGTKSFALTTHEHRLGTRARAWASAKSGDTSRPLADDQDWTSPAFTTLEPGFAFDGTNGFSYQCGWHNDTDKPARFGESALDEMCFVILYYYPSHGVDVCIDGRCSVKR